MRQHWCSRQCAQRVADRWPSATLLHTPPLRALARARARSPCPRPPAADNIIRKQAEDALGILERENFVRGGAATRELARPLLSPATPPRAPRHSFAPVLRRLQAEYIAHAARELRNDGRQDAVRQRAGLLIKTALDSKVRA